MTDLDALAAIAVRQFGHFTRAQAQAAGVTDRHLRRRIRAGTLVAKGAHVFSSPLVPTSPLSDLVALMLDVGGVVWASGPTAAALNGNDGFTLKAPFHLTIAHGRHVRRPPHVIHTSHHMNGIDRRLVHDIPVTAGARTLIDLARDRSVTDRALTAALDSTLRDLLTTEDHLHRRIAALRGRGRHGIPRLLAILEGHELTRGGHSWLEREFLRLLGLAGLPRPTTQAVVGRVNGRLIRVDCRWAGTPVVVELLGYRWHRTLRQTSRDAERFNAMVLDGLEPLQFTYEQVAGTPSVVIASVRYGLSCHLTWV